MGGLVLDHLHHRRLILVLVFRRLPLGRHRVDEFLRHLEFLRRNFTISRARERFRFQDFMREVHQLQDQKQPIRFDRRKVFAAGNRDLRDADLASGRQRAMENRVAFLSTFLRLQ